MHTHIFAVWFYILILDWCCLYTHICTYHQKQDRKQNVCCLNMSFSFTRIPVFTNVKGICFTKHFCLTPSQCTNSACAWEQWYLLKLVFSEYVLLLVKLLNWELLTLSASDILDPVLPGETSQSAFIEGQFAWLCSQHQENQKTLEQWLRAEWEIHLLKCLKIINKNSHLSSWVQEYRVVFKTFNHGNAKRDSVVGGSVSGLFSKPTRQRRDASEHKSQIVPLAQT